MTSLLHDVIVGFSMRPEDALLLRHTRPLAQRAGADLLKLLQSAGVDSARVEPIQAQPPVDSQIGPQTVSQTFRG